MQEPTPTGHLTPETAKRAYNLIKTCEKLNMSYGQAYTNPSLGDFIFFIICSDTDTCAIGCSPSCYTVEHENDDGTNYYLVNNIRNLLVKLNSLGMSGYSEDEEE